MHTEIIDKYLNSEMTPGERYLFEERLEADPGLRDEIDRQRSILQGIKFSGIRTELHQGFKKGALRSKARKWVIGAVLVSLAISAIFTARAKFFKEERESALYTRSKIARLKENRQSLKFPFVSVKNNAIPASGRRLLLRADGSRRKMGPAAEVEIITAPAGISLSSVNSDKVPEGAETTMSGSGKKTVVFGGKLMPDGRILWMDHRTFDADSGDSLKMAFYSQRFLDSLEVPGADLKSQKLTDSLYNALRVPSQTPARGPEKN